MPSPCRRLLGRNGRRSGRRTVSAPAESRSRTGRSKAALLDRRSTHELAELMPATFGLGCHRENAGYRPALGRSARSPILSELPEARFKECLRSQNIEVSKQRISSCRDPVSERMTFQERFDGLRQFVGRFQWRDMPGAVQLDKPRAGDLPAHGTHLGRRREGVVPAHDQQRGTIDPGQQPRAVWAIGQAPQRSGVANRIAGKNHLPQSIDDLRTSLQRGGRQQARNHGISQKTRAFQLYPPGRFQAPRGHLGASGAARVSQRISPAKCDR